MPEASVRNSPALFAPAADLESWVRAYVKIDRFRHPECTDGGLSRAVAHFQKELDEHGYVSVSRHDSSAGSFLHWCPAGIEECGRLRDARRPLETWGRRDNP